jgi:hypothetical protein
MADNDPKVLSKRSANGVRDRQTSVRQADQHLPRLCCRSGAVETNPDASTDIYFGPTVPEGQQQRLAHDRAGARRMDHSSPLQPLPIGLRQDLSAE